MLVTEPSSGTAWEDGVTNPSGLCPRDASEGRPEIDANNELAVVDRERAELFLHVASLFQKETRWREKKNKGRRSDSFKERQPFAQSTASAVRSAGVCLYGMSSPSHFPPQPISFSPLTQAQSIKLNKPIAIFVPYAEPRVRAAFQ